MEAAAQGAESAFAQAPAIGPDGGDARVTKLPGAGFGGDEAGLGDEIAEGLDVPGIKVMVRLGGVEALVARLVFEGDVKQQLAGGAKQAVNFRQDGGGRQDVLEGCDGK